MPPAPDVNLITRFVFENPFPLVVGLLVLGLVLGWMGLRDGRADRLRIAWIPALLGAVVLVTGLLVVTPGEHGRRVVRALVDAVVAEDLVASDRLFADDALYHRGSPRNPGRDLDTIRAGLSMLAARYDIRSNRITRLRGYGLERDAATVHLSCWTDAGGYGPSPSQWVVDVQRRADGSWRITHLTLVSVNGRPPPEW